MLMLKRSLWEFSTCDGRRFGSEGNLHRFRPWVFLVGTSTRFGGEPNIDIENDGPASTGHHLAVRRSASCVDRRVH